jgi:hypothetical protein
MSYSLRLVLLGLTRRQSARAARQVELGQCSSFFSRACTDSMYTEALWGCRIRVIEEYMGEAGDYRTERDLLFVQLAAAEPAALLLGALRDEGPPVLPPSQPARSVTARVICSPRSHSGDPRCYAWSRAGHHRREATGSGGGRDDSNAHRDRPSAARIATQTPRPVPLLKDIVLVPVFAV